MESLLNGETGMKVAKRERGAVRERWTSHLMDIEVKGGWPAARMRNKRKGRQAHRVGVRVGVSPPRPGCFLPWRGFEMSSCQTRTGRSALPWTEQAMPDLLFSWGIVRCYSFSVRGGTFSLSPHCRWGSGRHSESPNSSGPGKGKTRPVVSRLLSWFPRILNSWRATHQMHLLALSSQDSSRTGGGQGVGPNDSSREGLLSALEMLPLSSFWGKWTSGHGNPLNVSHPISWTWTQESELLF